MGAFSGSTVVDSGILFPEFHSFEALIWRRYFWIPLRDCFLCKWPRSWWSVLPPPRQSHWIESSSGPVTLHLCSSRTNNQYISLIETYPTLAFGVSKTIRIVVFGTHSSYHLTRLVCYLDGASIIQGCCQLRLVQFISGQGYTSNLIAWFQIVYGM